MRSYDVFFFGALYFLVGVFLQSVGVKAGILWLFLLLELASLAAWIFFGRIPTRFRWRIPRNGWLAMAALLFFLPAGALYYTQDDRNFRGARVPAGIASFSGVVANDPKRGGTSQEAVLALAAPYAGNVLLRLRAYPIVAYGDELAVSGEVEPLASDGYARYLAKERVSGIAAFPEFSVESSGNGSRVRAFLFGVRHRVTASFARMLPPEEAAFLGGITLGERSELSKEFKDSLQKSGTTHLVALSGYNITIVAWAAMNTFLFFLRRRWAFALSVLTILGFVLMTGGEASVVRAAIMGGLLLIAREAGRTASMRNAVLAAALAMVLANPKVLTFDVGFQLSFLAFLGIAYLQPALALFFKIPEDAGFLSWRDNLATTAAAQFAVAPLLIASFGGFSPLSLVANVLVLGLMPLTMGIGFAAALLAAAGEYFALACGWLAWVLLRFETGVIKFFGALSFPSVPAMDAWLIAVYYAALVGFIIYVKRHTRRALAA
ncbi:MAG: ComEC/Rec2 family competence protein [Candidatus Jorgensenbacteria bacterium]